MSTQVRKLCLLGDFGVGKTSTVRQFVESRYDDKYLTTVGVKIDTKTLQVGATELKLVIWDIAGSDTPTPPFKSYLKGITAYLMVVDGTRLETLDAALLLMDQLKAELGDLPWVGLLNKADLTEQWAIPEAREAALGDRWRRTSAKTGENVEAAFQSLAEALLA